MATFTLTDLKKAVDKKYAPTIIKNGKTEYRLENMLQLPVEKTDEVLELVDKFDTAEGVKEQIAIFEAIIEAVEVNGKGRELIDLLGGSQGSLIELGTTWMQGTELGEAER